MSTVPTSPDGSTSSHVKPDRELGAETGVALTATDGSAEPASVTTDAGPEAQPVRIRATATTTTIFRLRT
ncbi:hypothetical protein [Cryobacterium sp. Y11]|uniref:hypothetical protein n=1 Tax=Cryobacterium sp. Y11 TaxID=2045016 RepID=UPI0011B04ED7|nr:hypothetical protein [Cryobacterium sp. Y11]